MTIRFWYSRHVLCCPSASHVELGFANLLCISWFLLTEDYHRNCPLSTNIFHLQSPCLQMNMTLMIHSSGLTLDASQKVIFTGSCPGIWRTKHPFARNWETILLDNQLFQGGNSSRAQAAQSLLRGKAEPPFTFQWPPPVCQARVWDDDGSAPTVSPVPQYTKETLQWFYRDGNAKRPILKHPVRTGLCFWTQYLIVERHGQFWPYGLKL